MAFNIFLILSLLFSASVVGSDTKKRTRDDDDKRPEAVSVKTSMAAAAAEGGSPSPTRAVKEAVARWRARLETDAATYNLTPDIDDEIHSFVYQLRHLQPTLHPSTDQISGSEELESKSNDYAEFLKAIYRLTSSFAYAMPDVHYWWPNEVPADMSDHPFYILHGLAAELHMPEAWDFLAYIYEHLPDEGMRDARFFNPEEYERHCHDREKIASRATPPGDALSAQQAMLTFYAQKYLSTCPPDRE